MPKLELSAATLLAQLMTRISQQLSSHLTIANRICPLTHLIIDHYHCIECHRGADTLHAILRQQFWKMSARRVIRHCAFQCINCFRCPPQSTVVLMADLPIDKVTSPQPVFSEVSLDFEWQFLIKSSLLRNAKLLKAYFCVIVCLSTKVVHLEPVSSLSTEAFFTAMQRFVSRRGTPVLVHSDKKLAHRTTHKLGTAPHRTALSV